MADEIYHYDGLVYVRPIGRGIHLLELDWDGYLEEAAPEGYHRMRVVFERLSPDEDQHAQELHSMPPSKRFASKHIAPTGHHE